MASFTDKTSQFNPFIPELPAQEMVQVGMYKQKQYDAGVQKIQGYINNIAGMDVYNDGDYLLIDDYQKGHFFTYFLEADSFDPKLLTPVNTEFIGRYSVITNFKYNGQKIDREWGDTCSKGFTYYLS